FVFCDGGLNHRNGLGVEPNLIVGDFDSFYKKDFGIETIVLPCEKDDTDTFFAVKEALKRGFDDFLLIGCIGNRFDHSLCNVSVLLYLQEKNVKAILVDDYSEMQIVGSKKVYIEDSFSYFSLMCVAGDVEGVNILDAEYPLENAKIKTSYNYGISNKINRGKRSCVWVEKGCMLLIKVF
ncbi:MAG: thiamine diphosphokinase, partial [Treponema bryantii]|nr:thiamine diphosphokinase [Treponema bryantii]